MSTMQAAVVTSFDEPPHHLPFDVPPVADGQMLIDVVAVGLHPRVRSGASGTHYTSSGDLPLIPGVDGVGRVPGGGLVYFVADGDALGPMAEKAVVDRRRMIPLPDDVDTSRIAAGMNPAMSSWVALRTRVAMRPGQTVLVLGATGNAGAMAVQAAKLLGAGRVIAVGRNPARLAQLSDLGADVAIPLLDDDSATAAAISEVGEGVDIVLDYLWGPPTERVMMALMLGRADRSAQVDWVQIGSVAGADITLPSALLRASALRLLGNGQGSVSPRGYLAELPGLVEMLAAGRLRVSPRDVPLAEVESAWQHRDSGDERTVIVP
ncbi:quinone oxidoreductase family protein [Williamsia sterculiae]|uniref:NADPH2:quinone reductase n=1 Tax=Williamsia sterculiae TaxID=1344003 RepID=A0A1N7CLI0_9NOCA|nr:NADPH2:quinone reductase [Williamsia sterculiae]